MHNIHNLKDIKGINQWKTIEEIHKGWSEDIKYYVEDDHTNKYILRLSHIDNYDIKKIEYDYLKQLSIFNLNISIPLDFGVCNKGKNSYIILQWIDGRDAIEVLPTLNKQLQYNLGVEAGRILKKIHSLKPNTPQELWKDKYKRKIDCGIKSYKESGYSVDYEKDIINYIRENEMYLKDREVCFQHGDFHLGNMVIDKDNNLGIIDFNRCSFGDPWEEYDRYTFTWDNSIDFANGQIHGYFNNNVPDEFFRLICLYNARNSLASIPWALKFGEAELRVALKNIEKNYKVYNGYKDYIPAWYKEPHSYKI